MTGQVEPIAIVGMSCRFPGAPDPAAFWRLLIESRSATGPPPVGRKTYPGDIVAGFLHDVDTFEPGFFGITSREAAAMDPQQRVMLELAWESLENAGLIPADLEGTATGVFIGSMWDDYAHLTLAAGRPSVTGHTMAGLSRSLIANRISYVLGLRGPSSSVDTGQSSSLVAVHNACDSLRRGESDFALAGGVNLLLSPDTHRMVEKLGVLSPDNRCHSFDARANGIVRGEGGGLVVLRRLDDAIAAGDEVLCVIRGSAVNHDGRSDGLTTPAAAAQGELLRRAYQVAGVSLSDVDVVEMHATGTPVGDPVEAAALGAVLGRSRRAGDRLPVGSVKTNIGHLEGAAGIAGLLKTVLMLRYQAVPATLNHELAHPQIPLEELNLVVPTEVMEPPLQRRLNVAGVSSFGMGGTNCHVVVQTVARHTIAPPPPPPRSLPWVLSGRSESALRAQAGRMAAAITAQPDVRDVDIAWSLLSGRTRFSHLAAVSARDRAGYIGGLLAIANGRAERSAECLTVTGVSATDPRVAFVFPGQGSQWLGMAVDLMDTEPVFAESLQRCADSLAPHLTWSIHDVLRAVPGAPPSDRVDVVQPTLFAVMVSIAELWQSRGVIPAAVVGHSQGEIAAAHISGALSLDDAARIVALRSRLIREVADPGGMASITEPVDLVDARISDRPGLSIAAVNGPSSTIVAGLADELDTLLAECTADDVTTRRIAVTYASHSAQMDPVCDQLGELLGVMTPRPSRIPLHSSVTGGVLHATDLGTDYWSRNLRSTVRFDAAISSLIESGHTVFIECSPHPVLTTAVQEAIDDAEIDAVTIASARRDEDGSMRFAAALTQALARGVPVQWRTLFDEKSVRRVDLPTYAFDRDRHWFDSRIEDTAATAHRDTVVESAHRSLSRRLLQMVPSARESLMSGLVVDEVVAVLGGNEGRAIEGDRTYNDLGLGSVDLTDLRDRLAARTGLRLPIAVFYEQTTPSMLAHHLTERMIPDDSAVPQLPRADTAERDLDDVAIVAMSCRFPGGIATPEDLWRLIAAGGETLSTFPEDRGWDIEGLYHPDPAHPGTTYARSGGFLDDIAGFDAGFFGISPREANAMDPQQRVLLELAWEATERAGIDPLSLSDTPTGVYVGVMHSDYAERAGDIPAELEAYIGNGNASSVASGRIAYALGTRGPAMSVDTACSSSLVALHLAIGALQRGECSMALTGGATVMSSPKMFIEFSRQRAMSPDGRCKSFADSADGTGWSEGAGMLLLERLHDARRHGHPVLAVVRGSAVNQDGASNGLTAPNGRAQREVIASTLARAGLTASDVDALEAHGTGTALGDPIEAEAVLATYGQDRSPNHPLWLGSLKSNIGHTQAAAGVAGVIKMVLAMQHGTMPGSLHIDEPSTRVDWTTGRVALLRQSRIWPNTGGPRRAAVSSFGVSGTNAHVIVEQPPATAEQPRAERPGALTPWVISATNPAALREQATRLRSHLAAETNWSVADIGMSLAVGRAMFAHRAVLVGTDCTELLGSLDALCDGRKTPGVYQGAARARRTVFVFPGQGGQWSGMARELLETSPVFAARLAECELALAPHLDFSPTAVLRGDAGTPGLDRVDVVQPVMFAMMVSLAALWTSFGVEPSAVVGHSQGEIAAACVAGALTLDDAARVVAVRSALLRELSGSGSMVAVAMSQVDVAERLSNFGDELSIAAINGPHAVLVSGTAVAAEEFVRQCERDGIRAARVAVDYASHSRQVEPVRALLMSALASISSCVPTTPLHSTVTGDLVGAGELDAGYWYRNLRQTVRFESVIADLCRDVAVTVVEISPHPVLTAAMQDTCATGDVTVIGSLRRDDGGPERMLSSVAEAFVVGASVDWTASHRWVGARRIDLPTYAFQRSRYWIDAQTAPRRGDRSRDETVPREDGDQDGLRYQTRWARIPDPDPVAPIGRWIVITPTDCPVAEPVSRALADGGMAPVRVDIGDGAVGIDRSSVAEHLRGLADTGTATGVLSLLGVLEQPHPDHPDVPLGLAANLAVVQALGDASIDARLWCATQAAVRVENATDPSDASATPHITPALCWGLGRVVALEHPRRWGGSIDLPASIDDAAGARLRSVLSGVTGEDQVALRRSGAYGLRLARAPRPLAKNERWSVRGTALVTGGTGALGSNAARWLATAGIEHIAVLSRTGTASPGAAELAADLGALGVTVTTIACDVGDRAALAAVIDGIGDADRPLTVVVHAAGVLDDGSVDDLDPARLSTALHAKVGGAIHLDALTRHLDLKAFILFSSIGGTVGIPGQGNYAPGNAFLDSMALARRAAGLPATSIAWGPWAGGGMAQGGVDELLRRHGLPAMPVDTAIAHLQDAMDADYANIVIADIDWPRFSLALTANRGNRMLDDVVETDRRDVNRGSTSSGSALESLRGRARERFVTDLVMTDVAVVLGHRDVRAVPVDATFSDLGLDSVTGVELRNRIAVSTGLQLATTLVFDHPTPAALVQFVISELSGEADVATGPVDLGGYSGPVVDSAMTDAELFEFIDVDLGVA